MAPIIAAPTGVTKSHPAVIPTNPANIPFNVNDREGFLYLTHPTIRENKPPVHAAKLVVRNTCEMAILFASPQAANCEPGLNPNQPNHKINTPNAAKVKLWPGIAFDFLSLPYFPIRGPKMAAPTSAIHPPTE